MDDAGAIVRCHVAVGHYSECAMGFGSGAVGDTAVRLQVCKVGEEGLVANSNQLLAQHFADHLHIRLSISMELMHDEHEQGMGTNTLIVWRLCHTLSVMQTCCLT